MNMFAEEIQGSLNRLTGQPVKADLSGTFPLFRLPGRKTVIQAIGVKEFNESGLQRDFFMQQHREFHGAGHRIIHCWQDVWETKPLIVRSRLESICGKSTPVHGRECVLVRVPNSEMQEFLRMNHLIGESKGKYSFGLTHRGRLIAVALFGRSVPVQRHGITYKSHEMIRFCSLLGHYVQGGLSKLINHFVETASPDDIYTSVDRDWSDGAGFSKIGFRIVGETLPLKFWLDEKKLRQRSEPFEDACSVVNSGNLKMLRIIE